LRSRRRSSEERWSTRGLSPANVLERTNENAKWTTDLGNAFLAQQSDVMDAVQSLRKKATDSGKLESTEPQKVETKVVESKTIVEIQPANTSTVYVPSYSPSVVWGAPPYPYPPMYSPPDVPGAALFPFGMGMAVGAAIGGGWGCGWGGNNTVNVDNNNVVTGAMIGGFGLIAWPAQYGVTGIQTGQVNQDGIVYPKDLGPTTSKVDASRTRYNPDKTWVVTEDEP
jgi:hypothetical protein